MGRYARKKCNKGTKPLHSKYRMKRKTKDHDQIHLDMKPEQAHILLNQIIDYDVVGNAQFYCLHCARYFISNEALNGHFTTKLHKRRIKALGIQPYSQEEADRAGGLGSYIAPNKVEVQTQPIKNPQPTAMDFNSISNNMTNTKL